VIESNTRGDGHDVDAKVNSVLAIIARGELTSERRKALADEWGCTVQWVSQVCGHAFRLLRGLRPDLEDAINVRLAAIEEDRRIAASKVKHYTYKGEIISTVPAPDVPSMIAADRLYLETIGALIRTREVRGGGDGEGTDVLTLIRTELRVNPALVRSALAQMPRDEVRALLDAPAEVTDV
jgi:hypothetical protein